MHFRGLQGYGAIHWCPPIISFSIIVGIGLDYDIFLLVRIKEFRDLGYSTDEAIALGISKTGHIITAAGTNTLPPHTLTQFLLSTLQHSSPVTTHCSFSKFW